MSVTVNNEQIATLLICSMRYAMGRQTYIVGDVIALVREYWPRLNDADREVLQRDLAHEVDSGRALGSPIDHAEWVRLLEFMRSQSAPPVSAAGEGTR